MSRAAIFAALALALPANASLPLPALAQMLTARPLHRPTIILGRKHPGKISTVNGEGVIVNLKGSGTQAVLFSEVWRIRKAFASDEPAGTTVIDFANNRLFVATPLASLVEDIGKRVALSQFTAPNGATVYMAAGRITDISNPLPGLHNPLSKAVIGTRDGAQQVLEPVDAVKRIVATAHLFQ